MTEADWFLYDIGLRRERVNTVSNIWFKSKSDIRKLPALVIGGFCNRNFFFETK